MYLGRRSRIAIFDRTSPAGEKMSARWCFCVRPNAIEAGPLRDA